MSFFRENQKPYILKNQIWRNLYILLKSYIALFAQSGIIFFCTKRKIILHQNYIKSGFSVFRNIYTVIYINLEHLMAMKREMLGMGNFREVERINKIIKFREAQITSLE